MENVEKTGKGKSEERKRMSGQKTRMPMSYNDSSSISKGASWEKQKRDDLFSHYLNGDLSLHHGLAWGATVAPSSNSSSNPQFRFLSSLAAAKVAGQDRTKYAYLRFFPVTEATSCIVLRLHIERNTNQNLFGASRGCLRQRFVWPYSSCGQAKKNRCNKWEHDRFVLLGVFLLLHFCTSKYAKLGFPIFHKSFPCTLLDCLPLSILRPMLQTQIGQ